MEGTNEEHQERYRLVVAKHLLNEELSKNPHFRNNQDNRIKTTKYTIWTFLPKNLFEQFHRFANIYFLFIVCLNWIPAINAFGKEIAMLPLLFVLSVTAIKDLFEDRRRYNSDKNVNNTVCNVYDSSSDKYVPTKWKDMVVGDIVRLSINDVIPADILLLNSSDPHDICFIETANLDGETNLKQREIVKGLQELKNGSFVPRNFDNRIKCEEPNNHIYRFNGTLESSQDESKLSIGSHNLLLRGCMVRNTKWVEGIVVYAGHDTKAMLNNSGPRYKHSKVERDINLDVIACVVILFTLCFLCGVGCGVWTQKHAFFNSYFSPGGEKNPAMEGFIRFWTFIIIFQVLIPISLYVSAEIAKLGQVYLISQDRELYREETDQPVICRALNINEDLGQIKYIFSDKTGTLTENKMIFRKCSIGGTNFHHTERKVIQRKTVGDVGDSTDARSPQLSKASDDELYVEKPPAEEDPQGVHWDSKLAMAIAAESKANMYEGRISSYLREFFILLAICNTVVVSRPSSSPNTQEEDHLNNAQTTTVNSEQKGSNSTGGANSGTSTARSGSNIEHKGPQASSSLLVDVAENQSSNQGLVNKGLLPSPAKRSPKTEDSYLFSPEHSKNSYSSVNLKASDKTNFENVLYEAESPDEEALVKMASSYGFKLISRSPNTVTVLIPNEGQVTFQVLHVLAFDSSRKRMSVVVRRGDGEILMYCKGADSAVMPRLSSSHLQGDDDQTDAGAQGEEKQVMGNRRLSIAENTDNHLNMYARDGLRTLCMTRRELTEEDYQTWLVGHRKAETALHHREKLIRESAHALEKNMELLGATGIEDRLQDGVPETIAKLRKAGIKVWVLTGDKQETAVNVGYACKLLDSNMEKIILNAKSKDECSSQIFSWLAHLKLDNTACCVNSGSTSTSIHEEVQESTDQPLGLVIDGCTLMYALDKSLSAKFLKLTSHCQVVLCCRATPIQKASVVQLVRDGLKVMTLAIGDGANDVSMIQMADVGIGITGQEGMQAVMASDFAIGRFRFLTQLLLVHGHWCYDRITKMFLYFFYKNAMFVFVLFWFQLFNGFSGSNLIDDLSLILFNLVFTAVPPVICGILDKDLPSTVLNAKPQLYKSGQNGEMYTRKLFWLTILDALYQSVILFFCYSLLFEGTPADDRMVGITMHQAAVILANLHLGLATSQWTWIHHLFLWGSIILSFAWTICFGLVQVTHKIYFVSIMTLSSKEFWSLCVLISVTALLPRYSLLALRRTVCPTQIDEAQIQKRTKPRFNAAHKIDTNGYNEEPKTQSSVVML